MTIPMMPGWWDQNKEALESLAQTATRVQNPYFDSQLALMQNVRQNPANMQAAIDANFLNPEAFSQMFGPRAVQNFAAMGSPSSKASVERTARGIVDSPISAVPATVGARAAQRELGAPTAAAERIETATARRVETQADSDIYTFDRLKDINELQDPILFQRLQRIRTTLEENPGLANTNIFKLAEDAYNGRTGPNFNEEFEAIVAASPNAAKLFDEAMGALRQADRDNAQDRRAMARIEAQFGREDNILERQLRVKAAELREKYPSITLEDAYNFYKGGEDTMSAPARRVIQQDQELQLAAARRREIGIIAGEFTRAATQRNRDERQLIQSGISGQLSSLLGIPIEIAEIRLDGEGFFDKKNRFTIGGTMPITAEEIMQAIDNPAYGKTLTFKYNASQMDYDTASKNLQGLLALEPAQQAIYQLEIGILRQRIADIAATSNPTTAPTRATPRATRTPNK
jgi:hypothetical protein